MSLSLATRHAERRRRELASRDRVQDKRSTVQFLHAKAEAQRKATEAERFRLDPRAIEIEKHDLNKFCPAALIALGFSSYDEYLGSPLWLSIRRRVLEFFEGKCADCRRDASQVHHLRYNIANLSGRSLKGLLALCKRCHCRRHQIPYKNSRRPTARPRT